MLVCQLYVGDHCGFNLSKYLQCTVIKKPEIDFNSSELLPKLLYLSSPKHFLSTVISWLRCNYKR